MTEALAAELVGEHCSAPAPSTCSTPRERERARIFNLGYFTWVEQQGVALADFDRRRSQRFWTRPARARPAVGRDDHGLQSRQRHGRGCMSVNGRQTTHMSMETLVTPYRQLRKETLARDRGLREKVMSLEEAARLVKDGEHVGIGGCHLSRTPIAMIWALIRARKQNLTISRSITSTEGDLLLASGVSKHVVTSWFTPGHRVGRIQGDAPLHGEQARALRRVEPHVDRAALSRRRHGHALHAVALHARLGRRQAARRPASRP